MAYPRNETRHSGRLPDDRAHPLFSRRHRGRGRAGRDDLAGGRPAGHRDPASVLAAETGLSRRRQLPRLHGRDRGRARARRVLHPQAGTGHEGADRERARPLLAQDGVRAADRRPAFAGGGARSRIAVLAMGRHARRRGQPLPAPRAAGARPQPSGDGGAARRLHPMQSLRPRLPRGAGQRRDRHGGARLPRKDRLRFRRPDGQQHLRRLRRMRAGLPDRRADAGDPGRRERRLCQRPRPRGRQRLPLLRRRLPIDLQDPPGPHRRGRGQGRAGQPQPALRQGPLRLRLCAPPGPADRAADPQGRRLEARHRYRPRQSLHAFPQGDLGRGARPRRGGPRSASATGTAGGRWPGSARPRARTRRPISSRSWCAPGSAATMSITARGCATPPRSRR